MEQKKEVDYTILVIIVVVAIATLSFLFFHQPSPTGHVVAADAGFNGNEDQLQQDVNDFVKEFPLAKLAGDNAQMCLLINMGHTVYSFSLYKSNGAVEVGMTESRYCSNNQKNEGSEDFVIQYVDYTSFLHHKENPTCDVLKTTGAGEDFYYFPSEFMQQGGVPVCNAVFKERYCPVVRACAAAREMKLTGLTCCLTEAERQGPIPLLFNNKYLLFFLLLFIFGFTTIIVVFLLEEQKARQDKEQLDKCLSQLHNYVEYCNNLGLKKEEIKEKLLKLGWAEGMVDYALGGRR